MKKTEKRVYYARSFPVETFAAQSEREARSGQAAATVGRKIFCGKSGKTFCDTRTSRFSRRMNSSTRNL